MARLRGASFMEPYWLFWNIPSFLVKAFYLGLFMAALFFVIGLWHRSSIWVNGADDENLLPKSRLGLLVFAFSGIFSRECLLAKRVFSRNKLRGIFLIMITWGFILLMITLIIAFIDYYFRWKLFSGEFYHYFSLTADILGFLMFIGLIFAFIRRYFWQQDQVISQGVDTFMLAVFLVTVGAGFLVEGSRIAMYSLTIDKREPIGQLFAFLIKAFLHEEVLPLFHQLAWLVHVVGALVLLGSFPYSKLLHIITAPITTRLAQKREMQGGRSL